MNKVIALILSCILSGQLMAMSDSRADIEIFSRALTQLVENPEEIVSCFAIQGPQQKRYIFVSNEDSRRIVTNILRVSDRLDVVWFSSVMKRLQEKNIILSKFSMPPRDIAIVYPMANSALELKQVSQQDKTSNQIAIFDICAAYLRACQSILELFYYIKNNNEEYGLFYPADHPLSLLFLAANWQTKTVRILNRQQWKITCPKELQESPYYIYPAPAAQEFINRLAQCCSCSPKLELLHAIELLIKRRIILCSNPQFFRVVAPIVLPQELFLTPPSFDISPLLKIIEELNPALYNLLLDRRQATTADEIKTRQERILDAINDIPQTNNGRYRAYVAIAAITMLDDYCAALDKQITATEEAIATPRIPDIATTPGSLALQQNFSLATPPAERKKRRKDA
ncbi:hypothetical protein M1466_00325 [Candidatus Dependentiae bacterium]|nr:hypothetical protein [Candidatus Dependentiae bacterium]